jgi:phosphoribosylcarboxyaminoimidazole (NCAIR) mutase
MLAACSRRLVYWPPVESRALNSLDSLPSGVQMPGVAVAKVVIFGGPKRRKVSGEDAPASDTALRARMKGFLSSLEAE